MDDPWGSPWADESPHSLTNVETSSTKRPVTPDKPLSLRHATSSPWGDDDGFGDWTAAPTDEDLNAVDSADENIITTRWGPETAEPDLREEREDEIRHTWFTREITPAGLQDQTIKSPVFEVNGASEDPWAGALSTPVEEELNAGDDAGRDTSSSTVTPTYPVGSAHLEDDKPTETRKEFVEEEEQREVGGGTGREPSPKILPSTFPSNNAQSEDDIPSELDAERVVVESKMSEDDETTNLEVDNSSPAAVVENDSSTELNAETSSFSAPKGATQNDSPLSRPSSSPSDHSQHDEVVESPRTSFEEEPKRPKLDREGSSKVKQLVELFEGITVPEADSETTKRDQIEKDAEVTEDVEDEFGDFGDFEEGTSDAAMEDSPSATEEKSSTLVAAEDNDTTPQSPTSTWLESSPHTQEVDYSAKDHAPIDFNVDLSMADDLFIGDVQDASALNLDARSLDIDSVQETFSTIEQRKVWYRISRYGTMRKHNTGDEDYVRINWANSKVREETLRLVSKWMEEDRIGGGVILGGGNRLGSMFGWGDKNGAPLTLESAFAARKAKRRSSKSRSRKSSLQRTTTEIDGKGSAEHRRRRSSQSPISKKDSIEVPAQMPGLVFGWSTSQPTSAVSGTASTMLPLSNLTTKSSHPLSPVVSGPSVANPLALSEPLPISQKVDFPTHPVEHVPPAGQGPVPRSSRPAAITIPAPNNIVDLDDEWGEMVSSPAMEAGFSTSPKPLGHKSSKSAVNFLSPILSSNASTPRNPQATMNITGAILSPDLPVNTFADLIPNAVSSKEIAAEAPTADVWASADFSFFDTPSTSSAPPALPKTSTIPQIATLSRQAQQQKVTPSVRPTPYQIPSEEVEREVEKTVNRIVKNLPDLLYMLRR